MILIIGGAYQGKHDYLRAQYPDLDQKNLLDDLHRWVRAELLASRDPLQELADRLDGGCQDLVVVCEDIFCGVVPIDPQQRRWREATGRCCALLSARADRVVRLFCGIPTILK